MTTVSETIKRAIESDSRTPYRIAQEAGISQSTLSRFVNLGSGLSQDAIDRLSPVLGLELRPVRGRRSPVKQGRNRAVRGGA